jgi:membrane-associated phospholipid phosphatase
MIHTVLHALTNLGDSIITLPIAAAVLVWLAIWTDRRNALVWFAALFLCAGLTAALKIYFKACPLPGLDLDSPSGHTSMSFYVYGGVALVTAAQYRQWPRQAVLAIGALLILAVALSRAVLEYHSAAEVVIGVIIGTGALALFWLLYRHHRSAAMPAWPLWVAAFVPIAFLSGRSISAEGLLQRLAVYLHGLVGFCV